VKYWDSSALVSIFVHQASSLDVRTLHASDPDVATWILSDVEVRSAFSRLARERAVDAGESLRMAREFDAFWANVNIVPVVDAVKIRAMRLLAVHPLTAADALQLGAALSISYDNPATLDFVALDQRLRDAAQREGFRVLP
jgi:predicted nucleic acid-binding protein